VIDVGWRLAMPVLRRWTVRMMRQASAAEAGQARFQPVKMLQLEGFRPENQGSGVAMGCGCSDSLGLEGSAR